MLLFSPLLYGERPANATASPQRLDWKRVEVTIVARGPSVTSGIGNMDSYLALISTKRDSHSLTAARLVDYYPSFQDGLPDDHIASGRAFHLRLTYAKYCKMTATDFAVQQVFDQNTLDQVRAKQDKLPCFLVRR